MYELKTNLRVLGINIDILRELCFLARRILSWLSSDQDIEQLLHTAWLNCDSTSDESDREMDVQDIPHQEPEREYTINIMHNI